MVSLSSTKGTQGISSVPQTEYTAPLARVWFSKSEAIAPPSPWSQAFTFSVKYISGVRGELYYFSIYKNFKGKL